MIGQKLFALLQARGLSPIEAQGQEFDPYLHEAVLREEGAEGSDSLVVVQELQRGYRFHERVIRPTMVAGAAAQHSHRPRRGDRRPQRGGGRR